jgi:acyl-coenzyme A synthetase/AMP-(fatty) acid ligase
MKVEDGSLRIRSPRTAFRYLGTSGEALADRDGFVDTQDMVELRGDRYYFVGRRDGVINVGGLKVHPEEVEAVINRHPGVRMSLVRGRRNPITGALVVADVVAQAETVEPDGTTDIAVLRNQILKCAGRH